LVSPGGTIPITDDGDMQELITGNTVFVEF